MRVAVYYTPAPDSALARLGADWLGRDAFTGRATRAADSAFDRILADAPRYGLHATLRAPFRLRDSHGLDALGTRLAAFCAGRPRPVIARLTVGHFGRYIALVPEGPEPGVAALEADVLEACEPFRAPLTEGEVARRRPEHLTARQRALLDRWGYPHVLDEFRFHVTLAGPMPDDAPDLGAAVDGHFASVLGRPLPLDGLGLFVEPEPGAPFRVHGFHPFQPAGTP